MNTRLSFTSKTLFHPIGPIGLMLFSAMAFADPGDEVCFPLFRKAGAIPSTEYFPNLECRTKATTISVGLGTYFCTGSGRYDIRFCGKPTKDVGCKAPDVPNNQVGNPCDVGTGNKFETATDYQDATGLFTVTRYYNSSPAAAVSGIWGDQWQSGYWRKIISIDSTTALSIREDGKGLYFKLTNNMWTTDADTSERLTTNANGWQLLNDRNETEYYNFDGKLTAIKATSGRQQNFIYSDGSNGPNGGFILNANGTSSGSTLPAGLLIRITDTYSNRSLQFGYDSQNRVVKITQPDNLNILYGYQENYLASVTYPDGKIRQYKYNETGKTAANLPNALTGIIDENNNRFATWTYDANGRPLSSEHDVLNGTVLTPVEKVGIAYTTNSNGDITAATVDTYRDNAAKTTRIYTPVNVLGKIKNQSITQPSANNSTTVSTINNYDANGNLSRKTDFNGNTVCYKYDLARNLETIRLEGLAAGKTCPSDLNTYTPSANTVERKITTQWHSNYRLPKLITETGKSTAFNYDASGNLISKTVTDIVSNQSRTWSWTYNNVGQVLTANGPRIDVNDVTTYTYYSSASNTAGGIHSIGDLATVTNALGHVTSITHYDLNGRPLSITDPNGIVTTLTYWPRGWLKTKTINSAQTTQYDYDGVGQLIKVTLPDNSYLSYAYDTAHRLTDIIDSTGNKIHYTLDAMGNRIQEDTKDPSNNILKTRLRVFDALNRLQKDIGGTSPTTQITQYGYDNSGNLKTITDPLNHVTANGYDALNRLITVTDPANGKATTNYNSLDQITSIVDPKLVTTNYTTNALGNVTLTQSPDSGNSNAAYDSAGNITQKTDARGVVSNYTYDALNRVTSITYPASTTENVSFTYDSTANGNYGKGKLTGYSNDGGATVVMYDAYGNIIQSTDMIANKIYVTAYSFDKVNRLAKITYPSGRIITYIRNAIGQITQVQLQNSAGSAAQTVASSMAYRPFGPLSAITFANGVATTVQYDKDYRVSRYTTGSIPLRDVSYIYDTADNITQLTDANGTYTKTYGYDSLDRLISDINDAGQYQYQYDANSNRSQTTLTKGSQTTAVPMGYANNTNRLTSVQGNPVTHDAAGNRTNYLSLYNYTYNKANRVISSTITAGTQPIPMGTYSYNALGRRTQNMNQHYLYTVDGKYLETNTYNGATPSKRIEYVYADNLPIAQLQDTFNSSGSLIGTKITYIHADHLNTPRVMTDRSGKITWRWEGDAFGTQAPIQIKDVDGQLNSLDLRFPGQLSDTNSLYFYNINRYYDPTTGRYTQYDPIGLNDGLNPFGYTNGNPMNYSDPLGLYLSFIHSAFTNSGATQAGLKPSDAEELSELVVRADIGTQGIADSHRHAMCAARSNPQACMKKYEDFVHSELKKCTKEGLANAIHATQDSFSHAHRNFQWYGGTIALIIPFFGLDHIIQDATPGRSEQYEVPRKTADMIMAWEKECGCYGKQL